MSVLNNPMITQNMTLAPAIYLQFWRKRPLLIAILALLFIAQTTTAFAQSTDDNGQITEEKTDPIADDLAIQWQDHDELPPILGDPLLPREKQLEIYLSAGITPNEPFLIGFPITAGIGYTFLECLGIAGEISLHNLAVRSELEAFVQDHRANKLQYDLPQASFAALVTFSPIYGKSSLQNIFLRHFSAAIFAGPALYLTKEDSEIKIAVVAEGDGGFYSSSAYISEHLIEAGLAIKQLAGVPAFIACNALMGKQLVQLEEQLQVIPGQASEEDWERAWQSKNTVVF